MQAKVNFYLKHPKDDQTTVIASVHFRGARYIIHTREKIESKFWENQKAKTGKQYPDGYTINARLDSWSKAINQALQSFTAISPPHKDDFIQAVDKLLLPPEGIHEYLTPWTENFLPRSGRKAFNQIRHKTSLAMLKEYEKHERKKLRFKDIDLQFYRSFKAWCDLKKYSLNTFGTAIKHIKVWMNESEEEINHNCTAHRSRKFITLTETSDTIYLTEDELLKIHRLDLNWETILKAFPKISNGNLKKKLISYPPIRDRFLIGCFTALRVSDFTRLTGVNIKNDMIRIQPAKGSIKNEDVVIPVHWAIKEILSRGFDWNKKVYDQKINEHIKHIARMAGINQDVTITRTEGSKKVSKVFKKYELVTTHTARRSGATNMYKAGIPSLAIMKITGHTTERSFLKYIKVSQEENAKMLQGHPFFRRGGA